MPKAVLPEEVGKNGIRLVSPKYYFPIDSDRGFHELIVSFTLLYALSESFILVGEGQKPNLEAMLEQFKNEDTLLRVAQAYYIER